MPPKAIPAELVPAYTLRGASRVRYQYCDDTAGKPRFYPKGLVESMIEAARARQENYYGLTDRWLYQALDRYGIAGKSVLIYGSQQPWYESICLSRGATCTTVEYQEIESDHPGIRAITPNQLAAKPERFEMALAISSFEHDGLGRYGDPLNPDGDLAAMRQAREVLQPGGLLLLAVPCAGEDVLVWNAHRIYGPKRLALLLAGWQLLAMFGHIEAGDPDAFTQPVFVLKKPLPGGLCQ